MKCSGIKSFLDCKLTIEKINPDFTYQGNPKNRTISNLHIGDEGG